MVEDCVLLYFNINKTLTNGKYLLDTWGDLQQHLNQVGKEKAKDQIKYVEENGNKLSKADKKKVKKQLMQIGPDRKTELMMKVLSQLVEDIKIPEEKKQVKKEQPKP